MNFAPLAASLALSGIVASATAAETGERPLTFGVQGSCRDDGVLGLGVRVARRLSAAPSGRVSAVVSFDDYFPPPMTLAPGGAQPVAPSMPLATRSPEHFRDFAKAYWELNANLVYGFSGTAAPYFGAGINLGHAHVRGTSRMTEADIALERRAIDAESGLGLNLLAGVRVGPVFAESKIARGGGGFFTFAVGARF
jgi:opacity protein-like surface antigen